MTPEILLIVAGIVLLAWSGLIWARRDRPGSRASGTADAAMSVKIRAAVIAFIGAALLVAGALAALA